jgi:hypothetical protein
MTTNHDLAEQIEQLVRNHMEAMRAAAAAAVERAFTGEVRASARLAAGPARSSPARANVSPWRTEQELEVLGERFYEVLCQHPGETMTTLAPQIGASPRALKAVVARLKRAGRVRTVGQRQFTRYFPMMSNAAIG